MPKSSASSKPSSENTKFQFERGACAPLVFLAAAAVVIAAIVTAATATTQGVAATVAEQEDQDDDPANVTATETVVIHNDYLRI